MSTVAYRASLIREIQQAMRDIQTLRPSGRNLYARARDAGELDAYAHMLTLISDMEDQ